MAWINDALNALSSFVAPSGKFDWGIVPAAGQAVLGTLGTIAGAKEASRQRELQKQMTRMAQAPLDFEGMYAKLKPSPEVLAYGQRTALGTTGLAGLDPTGGAARGLLAETMGKLDTAIREEALRQAIAARQAALYGMAGTAGLRPSTVLPTDIFSGFSALMSRRALEEARARRERVQNSPLGQAWSQNSPEARAAYTGYDPTFDPFYNPYYYKFVPKSHTQYSYPSQPPYSYENETVPYSYLPEPTPPNRPYVWSEDLYKQEW